ncbi:MAG: hypothetical protein AB7R55_01010 [Gemmatimonadales bacterium]
MFIAPRRWGTLSLLLATTSGAASAQIDYRNLDHARPLLVADAALVERYAFELSLPFAYRRADRADFVVASPEIQYGIGRNLAVGAELELEAGGGDTGLQGAKLFASFNPLRETLGAPAISVQAELGRLRGGGDGGVTVGAIEGLATRSFGRSRLHANLLLQAGTGVGDDLGLPRWRLGVALDRTLIRSSTLVGVELLAADAPAGSVAWLVGLGLRRQVSPTLVAHLGLHQALEAGADGTTVRFGLSHVFAIRALMPGVVR